MEKSIHSKIVNFLKLKQYPLLMTLQTVFDEEVRRYNEWLTSSKERRMWNTFLNSVCSLLSIVANPLPSSQNTDQEFYGFELHTKTYFTPRQKDAITMGSDMKRIITRLDTLLSRLSTSREPSKEGTTLEEATVDRQLAQQMYEHYKNVYCTN